MIHKQRDWERPLLCYLGRLTLALPTGVFMGVGSKRKKNLKPFIETYTYSSSSIETSHGWRCNQRAHLADCQGIFRSRQQPFLYKGEDLPFEATATGAATPGRNGRLMDQFVVNLIFFSTSSPIGEEPVEWRQRDGGGAHWPSTRQWMIFFIVLFFFIALVTST